MDWIEVNIKAKRELEEIITDHLYSYDIDGVTVEDDKLYFDNNKINPEWCLVDLPGDKPSDYVLMKVFFDESTYEKDVKNSLYSYIKNLKDQGGDLELVKEEKLLDRNWETEWMKYFKPIEIGERLVVKPTWEEYDNKEKRLVIDMDPGMVFGTGSHATTAMCLKIEEEIDIKDKTVLDIGTGSGILAIASGMLGAKSVMATDIDPLCVEYTMKNAALNGQEDKIEARVSDLTENLEGKYQVVTINIIAEVIAGLIPDLGAFLADGAKIIMSGILEIKKDLVLDALHKNSYREIKIDSKDGWVAILAERENA